jgi:hypothetical protein
MAVIRAPVSKRQRGALGSLLELRLIGRDGAHCKTPSLATAVAVRIDDPGCTDTHRYRNISDPPGGFSAPGG